MHDQRSGDHSEIMHYSTRVDQLVHDHINKNRYDHALISLPLEALFVGVNVSYYPVCCSHTANLKGQCSLAINFVKGGMELSRKLAGEGCAERPRRLLPHWFGVEQFGGQYISSNGQRTKQCQSGCLKCIRFEEKITKYFKKK